MRLRLPEKKDVPLILEWMKDPEVNRFFRFDPTDITEETVFAFVERAQNTEKNLHMVCADVRDEYLGTVSLKEIDPINGHAEYAVSFRAKAHGTGAAAYSSKEILRIAFEEIGLHRVYLNVYGDNLRACRFYEKIGFVLEGVAREHLIIRGEYKTLCWYGILKTDWEKLYGKKGGYA